MRALRFSFVLTLALLAGCAHRARAPGPSPSAAVNPSTQPVDKAHLTLDQILPRPWLAAATRPSDTPVSVEALVLFAKGMDQLWQGNSRDAIDALESALQIDQNSFAIYEALGQAYLQRTKSVTEPAIAAFERAAALRPDDLHIQYLLARHYMDSGNSAKIIEHLRLAKLTSEYQADAPGSAAVELLLARALQQEGYDRAALDEYQRFGVRLANPDQQLRADPDVGFIVNEPELVWLQIAQLQEKLGNLAAALESYEPAAKVDPANFQLQARIVQILVNLGRGDDATHRAADLIEVFHASPPALDLLRQVCKTVGSEKEIALLQKMHQENPADRPALFALADVLAAQGKISDARKLLEEAVAANSGDMDLVRNLFDFDSAHDDLPAAARLLATQLAANPDSVRQVDAMFAELIRPLRKHPLHLSDVQNLEVTANAAAAKLYLVASAAAQLHRDAIARTALEDCVKLSPPFAPAFVIWVNTEWSRADLSAEQKSAGCNTLADAIAPQSPALAEEIRGLSLLNQKDNDGAVAALGHAVQLDAMQLGGSSPDLQFSYASALKAAGKTAEFEHALWALTAKFPQYDQAWNTLHEYYLAANKDPDALKVLAQWLRADPASELARLYESIWHLRHDERDQGVEGLGKLLDDHPEDSEMITAIEAIYGQLGQADAFTKKLEQIHAHQPGNLAVVAELVAIYGKAHRNSDASHLLDETRAALGNDSDGLYFLASLYRQIGQMPMWEEVLGQVLTADAGNVPASNDLGYAWADAGKNLDRAERMIRAAVAAEPDNQAFLDSLGWVLYKRGRFAEAERYFRQAIEPAQAADPEVLDHFGDDLYRLGRPTDAQKQWQQSLEKLQGSAGADEGEILQLRMQVQRKVRDSESGQQVDVAPIAPVAQQDGKAQVQSK
jgi:tetratricopeptide (TPR) repeat protein